MTVDKPTGPHYQEAMYDMTMTTTKPEALPEAGTEAAWRFYAQTVNRARAQVALEDAATNRALADMARDMAAERAATVRPLTIAGWTA